MSRIKSLSNKSDSSDCIDGDSIDPSLRVEYNKIINDIQHQLFFDQDLTHQHQMYILNNRNTIESELIEVVIDRINHLNIHRDIRERLITDINKFSSTFTPINRYSNINYRYHVNYDSEEESYDDYSTDDIYSDEDDSYNDLENLILDQIEMEQNIRSINNDTDHQSN